VISGNGVVALAMASSACGSLLTWRLQRWYIARHPVAKARVLLAAKVVDGKPMPDMNRRDRRAAARKALKEANKGDLSKLDRMDGLDSRR
jgi:hypothetical protein